jgi:transcriptional regulator with XRE-family HTH domain
MAFSDRLKALRKAAGLTQEALARAADLSSATVAKLERLPMGPAWDTAVKLADALGVSLDAFRDGEAPAAGGEGAKDRRRRKGG